MTASNNNIPEWLQQIIDQESKRPPIKRLLQNESRKAMWSFCSLMQVSSWGIPGQACHLFERYLTERFDTAAPALRSAGDKKCFTEELSSEVILVMTTCIQLASKMVSIPFALTSKLTRNFLFSQGIHCTVSDINRVEMSIYKLLDYQIPQYTSVDIAQLLATEIGLPITAMKEIALFTDLAEYNRDKMNRIVQRGSQQLNSDFRISTLHLAAGSTAAAAQLLPEFADTAVIRLADLTKVSTDYIKCIIKAIFSFALP